MADLSTLEIIKASEKPTAEDFSYIYAESGNKAFIRIAKDKLKEIINEGNYTNEEIDKKISSIPKFNIEVVSSLPTTDISETTIYLVSSGDDSENLYTEYININGLWEILGTQKASFSGSAKDVTYDDTETQLGADNVQDAVGKLSNTIADYKYVLTDEEKQEIADTVKAEVPLVKSAEQPTIVNSIDEMTDTSKVYVLSTDGYFYAYKESLGTEVLKAEDFTVGTVSTNGLQNTSNTSKNRIFSKILPLENGAIKVNCPSDFNFLVYFYNTDSPTETSTTTLSSDVTGKTTWSSADWEDITDMSCTTGSMDGATHCRISFKHTSATDLTSYLSDFVANNPITINAYNARWTNTGLAYNQPSDYEDRIIALENAFGGIAYGTY